MLLEVNHQKAVIKLINIQKVAKIVHFGKYYFPDMGGIESVTRNLSLGSVRSGHKVSVVCFGKNRDYTVEQVEEVIIHRMPIWFTIASQPIGLRYILKCILVGAKSDIVHLHVPNILGSLCVLLFVSKIKLIVHWHSDIINKGFLGKIVWSLQHAILIRSNFIIATSDPYAKSSSFLRFYQNKLVVLPISIDEKLNLDNKSINSRLVKDGFSTEISDKNHKKIVLGVGRLVCYKGFDNLIRAAEYLNGDSILVIAGDGPLKEELNLLVFNLGLTGKVYLLGKVSNEVLRYLYLNAHVFCLPSVNRAEAFGVVLLEAMSYGIPIVATNINGSGVPWVNLHGVSGLNVAVGDAVGLARACNLIIENDKLRLKLSEGALHSVRTRFSEAKIWRKMGKLYRTLHR